MGLNSHSIGGACEILSITDPWYYEEYSRPIFQHTCKDRVLSRTITGRMGMKLSLTNNPPGNIESKQVVAIERILLDLYVRHKTTGGRGNIGIFTSNGKQTGTESLQYKKLGVAGAIVKRIVDSLSQGGYVEAKKGTPGHSTKIRATLRLIDQLESLGLSMEKLSIRPIWPIVWSPLYDKKDQKQALSKIPVKREVAELRGLKTLLKCNAILQKTDIRVGELKLYPFEKQLKRIFKDPNCTSFGRLHGGAWQVLPGSARPFLTINGMGTVEVDICSTHPLIAYAINGYDLTEIVEAEGKPYDLKPFQGCSHQVYLSAVNATDREILKRGLMNCFNCESQLQAQQALWEAIRQHRDSCTGRSTWWMRYSELSRDAITYPEIIEGLTQKHWRISGWLFQPGDRAGWLRLNWYESEVAMKVIERFTKNGVPILPIHDSFIVQADKAEELKEVLVASIEDVLGMSFKNKHFLINMKIETGTITRIEAERMLTEVRLSRDRYIQLRMEV